ncbi:HAD family hydrolase [Roseateles sp. BYS180W]|uniref:HAD family hydrolase n=1 Tax=Roseateles rivi TaxID=3299028 RepID=A0ABW7FRG3_9BURK
MNIVFDFGGVLFHWHPPTFLARVWPHRVRNAQEAEAVAREFFQAYTGDWGAFDQGLADADETAGRIAERTGWPLAEVQQVMAEVPEELQAVPQTVALLLDLKAAGHRLHYLSNMPQPYADHLERAYPLQEWFVSGVFSSRVKQSKPQQPIFDEALRRIGAPAAECLFLDDHPANVEAARALGWQAELFTSADALRPLLRARGLLGG